MMIPVLVRLLIGTLFAVLLMVGLWFRQRATKNAGIVDVGWAGAIGVVGAFFAIFGEGYLPRRILLAALIGLWSLRLTTYLYRRVHGESEDGRYAKLRAEWGETFQKRIFTFYQMQAAAVILFAAPILVGSQATREPLGWLDGLGVLLWLIGVAGVTTSDAQLARYRKKPEARGKTCREGLWSVSRHPNYFFEWVHWWAYVPIACGAPAWWMTVVVPLLLLYFLLCVTGIPVTEANALASRGDDYRNYQRSVSAFIPWFPKRISDTAHHESH
jgi:steroid 5-alpha reductase family enzyme